MRAHANKRLNSKETELKHEQSLADEFHEYMRRQSKKYGCRFHSFSLDGQDRDVGADYLLTDSDRFTIIEFKYSEKELVNEKHKERRLKLCIKLEKFKDMCSLHDKCHYVTWLDSLNGLVNTNIYRFEICNSKIFGATCGLTSSTPEIAERIPAKKFASDFFSPGGSRSLSLKEFEDYLAWVLTETSGSEKTTLELVARNTKSNDLALVRLGTISEAQKWVKEHTEPPKPPRQQRSRRRI